VLLDAGQHRSREHTARIDALRRLSSHHQQALNGLARTMLHAFGGA